MGNNIDRRNATRYAIRQSLSAPKYMRKASWGPLVKVMPRDSEVHTERV
jgi:hypothetical protein